MIFLCPIRLPNPFFVAKNDVTKPPGSTKGQRHGSRGMGRAICQLMDFFQKSIEILKNLNSSSKIGPVFVDFPEAIKVDGGVVHNPWIRRLGFCPFHGRAIELIGFTIPRTIIHGWYQPSNYGRFTMTSSQKPEIRRNFCRMRN